MKKKKVLAVLLVVMMTVTMFPLSSFAAAKKDTSVKTYVFFGSDSRANNDAWRSPGGGKIKADKSGTQGTPRSDVIMLLKVDNKNKRVDVISIYRDTLLDVSGKGTTFEKANMAYANLGPKKAVKALEKNLNIKIDGYVATNFKGVAEVIDALGGVTITVENDKVTKEHKRKGRNTVKDVMNEYISEMDKVYGLKTPKIKKAGKQKLTGIQAVAYARVRYTDGADLRRSVRQRTVLSAMSSKYRNKKTSKVVKTKVLLAVMNNVDTNIKPATLKKLFSKAAGYKIRKKNGFPYYKRFYNMKSKREIGGVSAVYVPCDLATNVTKLHKVFYGKKSYKPSKTVKSYSSKIIKKTKLTYSKRTKSLDNKY